VAGLSEIEWTDATWNPIAGCTMISPGCTNCYAMRMAARLQAIGHPAYADVTRKSGNRAVWTGRINISEKALAAPLKWRAPKKVFVNSMSDLFQDGVPFELVIKVWEVMASAHWHIFQILTKRPDNMLRVVKDAKLPTLSNVWLGTSVESAKFNSRVSLLRRAPAAVRFVSFEPLVGPVGRINLTGIHWAIVGGESGPGARPMEADWVEELRVQCKKQAVAFFFKQWGGTNKKAAGRTYRGRTWDNFPKASAVPLPAGE
jgi:protein gp37